VVGVGGTSACVAQYRHRSSIAVSKTFDAAAYVVKDSNGQKLDYVYYEEEPGRQSAAKLFSKDEARRIAANFAKPLGLLRSQ
jgi:hypothetical protein